MALRPGTRLGSYEVVAPIGSGGMGEVFRARDTDLRREVALKVLPDHFAGDSERLARFQREAQILASLNHPHIAGIYGIAEGEGARALVLELVEGPTLAERLAAGRIPLDESLRLALQIAHALEAAHDKGVIHRDLKPANIKLTPHDQVKVLDFGLAKAFDISGSPTDPTLASPVETGTGMVMGTAAYMSPEQARGKTVDKRTDIWAFGCVLYEMLSGDGPFQADTASDTIAAILGRDPDWSRLPAATPPRVRFLLQRCLEKDPKERLRDIGDARIELREAIAMPAGVADSVAAPPPPTGARWWIAAAAVGAAILIGTAMALWPRGGAEPSWRNPLDGARFTRLTDFEGSEYDAAISPDGKFVAFRADRDGRVDVWLTQVGTGRFVNLTQGKEEELLLPVRSMGFSHDGSEIWLAGRGLGLRRLRLMPLMGGAPRPFLPDQSVNVTWSPDGARVAYHGGGPGDPMFVADRTGANARQIFTLAAGGHNHFPAWSADGWIYFVSGIWELLEMDLYRISPSGGTPEQLTRQKTDPRYVTPLDAHTVLYTAPDTDGSGPWLWALDLASKTTRRVTSGLEKYTSIAASADGRRLVATVANPSASLWTLPILDRIAEERDAKPFALPSVRARAPRFGATSLFYLSSTGAGDGLWRYQDGQALEIWKGTDGRLHAPPAVSPDGTRVAVVLRKDGRLRLHVMSADGAELQALTDAVDVRGTSGWSPDGKWLVTGGNDAQGAGLFKIPADGGAPVRLRTERALNPAWSPDGMLIVYTGALVANLSPLLAVRPDGTPVDISSIGIYGGTDTNSQRYRFVPNGKSLVYMQGASAWQDFWMLDLETRKTRQLTRLTDRAAMWTFDITPDGKQIVFDRSRENSDVVLIDVK